MGHGGASARPLGRSRSTGFLPRSSSLRSLRTNIMSSQAASGGSAGLTWPQVLIILVLVGLVVAGGAFLVLNTGGVDYAVVIDSGSTGTRCYVYSWARRGESELPKVVDSSAKLGRAERFGQKRAAYKRVETEPGLDQFVGDVTKLNEALDPLLQYALKEVPQSKRAATPIFLFATAGLRRLPSDQSSWILQMTQETLSASPFLFKTGWARIISGQDEAVYGWIALNYLTGKLRHDSELLGSLDLGGSSLEVTFLPEKRPEEKHGTNVTIRGMDYQLYAHSHSSFGLNDAFEKSVLLAMEDAAHEEQSLQVAHPCLQAGYNATYHFKHRSPDVTVSSSALADKALEGGTRRRLLRWAADTFSGRNPKPRDEVPVQNPQFAENIDNLEALSTLQFPQEHSVNKLGMSLFSRLLSSVKPHLGSNSKEPPATLSVGSETGLEADSASVLELLKIHLRPWFERCDQVISQLTRQLARPLTLQNAQSAASPPRVGNRRSRSHGLGANSTNPSSGLEPRALKRLLSKRTQRYPRSSGSSNMDEFLSTAGQGVPKESKRGEAFERPTELIVANSVALDSTGAEAIVAAMSGVGVELNRGKESGGEGRPQAMPTKSSGEVSGFHTVDERATKKRRSLAEQSVPASVMLVGRPDWPTCQKLVDRVVTSAGECDEAPCALGAHQPALRGQFMALTGFFVVYHFFGLPGSAPLGRLLEAGQAFCEKSWADVETEFVGERGYDRYCFRAPYVVSLLQKGLGLQAEQVRVGTGDMAWTLGAALYEGGALKVAAKPLALERPGGQSMSQLLQVHRSQLPATFSGLLGGNLPLVIVILALVGLTAVTVVRWCKNRARSFDARARKTYLPLYAVASRSATSDGGKPGHALSRRLMERQRASLLEPIPASPPSISVKAPTQSGLASRRTTSVDTGTELQRIEVQRNLGGELNQVEEEYSP